MNSVTKSYRLARERAAYESRVMSAGGKAKLKWEKEKKEQEVGVLLELREKAHRGEVSWQHFLGEQRKFAISNEDLNLYDPVVLYDAEDIQDLPPNKQYEAILRVEMSQRCEIPFEIRDRCFKEESSKLDPNSIASLAQLRGKLALSVYMTADVDGVHDKISEIEERLIEIRRTLNENCPIWRQKSLTKEKNTLLAQQGTLLDQINWFGAAEVARTGSRSRPGRNEAGDASPSRRSVSPRTVRRSMFIYTTPISPERAKANSTARGHQDLPVKHSFSSPRRDSDPKLNIPKAVAPLTKQQVHVGAQTVMEPVTEPLVSENRLRRTQALTKFMLSVPEEGYAPEALEALIRNQFFLYRLDASCHSQESATAFTTLLRHTSKVAHAVCCCLLDLSSLSRLSDSPSPDSMALLQTYVEWLRWCAETDRYCHYVVFNVTNLQQVSTLCRTLRPKGSRSHGNRMLILAAVESGDSIQYVKSMLTEVDGLYVGDGENRSGEMALQPVLTRTVIQICTSMHVPCLLSLRMRKADLGVVCSMLKLKPDVLVLELADMDVTDALKWGRVLTEAEWMGDQRKEHYELRKVWENSPLQAAQPKGAPTRSEAVARAAASVAMDVRAACLIVQTSTGRTAEAAFDSILSMPLVVVSDVASIVHGALVRRGQFPLMQGTLMNSEAVLSSVLKQVKARGLAKVGDLVVFTAGSTPGAAGLTSSVHVMKVEQ